MDQKGRLIVASTRLPVVLTRRGSSWEGKQGAGGLVTALKSVSQTREFEWWGWAGTSVSGPEQPAVRRELAKYGSKPVFLTKNDVEGFYSGFSNRVLWPLFHGITSRSNFTESYWNSYQRVNQIFADALAKRARPGDLIWIHDYQLCLVPELLRQRGLECPIGFFLHVPFPSSEIYRTLPVREELLKGLLGADFIGFHAYEYVSHFRKSCLRVLGLESLTTSIRSGTREVSLGVLPIGIDPEEIREMTTQKEATTEEAQLRAAYRGKKIILGVDRLDYTKGIPEKLQAFEALLKANPKLRTKCVLIQVAAPSRESVNEYQELRRQVEELVGHINGRYGSPSHTPVVYINQSVSRTRLVGMYRAAEICLVTPIRDGMNLVAMEYVAARGDQGGSLILSEFAGAAYLLPGAKLINPYNVAEVAATLEEELNNEAPDASHMLEFVNDNTALSWANRFIEQLEQMSQELTPVANRLRVDEEPAASLLRESEKRLILLDYDGTLRAYERKPNDAVPNSRIRDVLRHLAEHSEVYIVSGRPADVLDKWLGDLPIGLVCEHGFSKREHGGPWQQRRAVGTKGLQRVGPLFEEFCRRTPGARVELKKSSIAWHYRSADPELAAIQVNELLNELEELLRRRPFSILRGNKVIEVRHVDVSKGQAAEGLLKQHSETDVVICAGDDRTDEDMMEVIRAKRGESSVLCWVGRRSAVADFWTESCDTLLNELEALARMWDEELLPASRRVGARAVLPPKGLSETSALKAQSGSKDKNSTERKHARRKPPTGSARA